MEILAAEKCWRTKALRGLDKHWKVRLGAIEGFTLQRSQTIVRGDSDHTNFIIKLSSTSILLSEGA